MSEIPPALYLIAGAIALFLVPRRFRSALFLAGPALALWAIWGATPDHGWSVDWYGQALKPFRVDALSRVFGLVFAGVALVGGVFAWSNPSTGEKVSALLYAGGGLGVVFAGDYLSLLAFWELMALASTFLIWFRGTEDAEKAAWRYLLIHLAGGSLLLGGAVWEVARSGDWMLHALRPDQPHPAAWLMMAGVAVNAAVPPLHAWLSDAYPRASASGAVFLSAFTTKSAVYLLARLFPGWDLLITAGVGMVVLGSIYGLLVNDIRRILAYSTISQVGYMVTAVGVGTALALNGVAAHAFSHILYKGLLFMVAGAILEATGRQRLSDLGGLARSLPGLAVLYAVGAAAISGAPLFNGYISKTLLIGAVGDGGHDTVKLILIVGSVATWLHTGLRLPYHVFWGHDRQVAVRRPVPVNQWLAMAVLALACLGFGLRPGVLYQWLPSRMSFHPYTFYHVTESLQLLLFGFAAFWWWRSRLRGQEFLVLDVDWFYRRPGAVLGSGVVTWANALFQAAEPWGRRLAGAMSVRIRNPRAWLLSRSLAERCPDFDPNLCRSRLERGLALVIGLVILVVLMSWI